MSTPYTGNPAGIVARQAVTVANPVDGEDLTAASNNSAIQTIANILKYVMDKAGLIDQAQTWTALQNFGGQVLNNLGTPVAASDAATKAYVDAGIIRNFIINGRMDFSQRVQSGVPQTLTTTRTYHVDRWAAFADGGTAILYPRAAAGITGVPGIERATQLGRAAASTNANPYRFRQEIDRDYVLQMAGKTCTVSFWAKKNADWNSTISAQTSQLQLGVLTGTDPTEVAGTAGYATGATALRPQFTLTTSWQQFSYTFSVGSTAQAALIEFVAAPTATAAGAADNYQVTGVMLYAGTATGLPFAFSAGGAGYAGELLQCLRYFEKSWALGMPVGTAGLSGSSVGIVATGTTSGTQSIAPSIRFMVPKRVTPTIVLYSGLNATINQISFQGTVGDVAAAASNGTDRGFHYAHTAGAPAGGATAWVHWTADAEF